MIAVEDKPMTTAEIKPFLAKFYQPVPGVYDPNQISAATSKREPIYTGFDQTWDGTRFIFDD